MTLLINEFRALNESPNFSQSILALKKRYIYLHGKYIQTHGHISAEYNIKDTHTHTHTHGSLIHYQ